MRLDSVSRELGILLKSSSVNEQRFAGLLACKKALEFNCVENATVDSALIVLEENGYLPLNQRNELDCLVANFDEKYFNLINNPIYQTSLEDAQIYFSNARAISALSFAGTADALTAATESIYEASMSVDEKNSIFDLVKSYLTKKHE